MEIWKYSTCQIKYNINFHGFPFCGSKNEGFSLTEREKADIKYRKDVLEYARKHDRAADILNIKRYHVPDAKIKSIPTDYIEEPEEASRGDGRRWEDERLSAAISTYGAKDADKVTTKILIANAWVNFQEN